MKVIIELDTNNKEDKDLLDKVLTISGIHSITVDPDSSAIDIYDLELPTRVTNAFMCYEINTINKLRECLKTNPERRLKGIGKYAVTVTKEKLKKYDEGKRGKELWL